MLTWYCAGRRLHLGPSAREELAALSEGIAPIRVIGGVSLGEIGSTRPKAYPLFHNSAVSLLNWNRR